MFDLEIVWTDNRPNLTIPMSYENATLMADHLIEAGGVERVQIWREGDNTVPVYSWSIDDLAED